MLPRIIVTLLLLSPLPLLAQSITDAQLEELLRVKVRTVEHLAFNPVLLEAVEAQNAQGLTREQIDQRDQEWQAAPGLTAFKRSLQVSPAGKVLERYVSRNPSFNEAFLTDNQGANVAAYPATSDYWQGDEEKWSVAFRQGQTHIGPIEKDESTQTAAAQVSAPLYGRDGKPIGVLVVGVTLDYLEARKGR